MADQEEKNHNNPLNSASSNKTESQNEQSNQFSDKTNIPSNNYANFYTGTPDQYANMREYAQVLHSWLWQYRMLNAFSTFQSQMLASMQQNANMNQNCQSQPGLANFNTPPQDRNSQTPPAQGTGTQYRVPLLWRRVVAEFLDFILLFYLKILVTVAVLRQMGYMNDDLLELDSQIPLLSDFTELDYEKMFSLTSELIALEVINRLCITLVETMCIKQGYAGSVGGATPGKKIMQLRVVSFDEIRESRDRYIVITGTRDPGFVNALIRSVIKNFSMAFFFPASFTVFFFRYNRAAYDVLAQTVVVEVDPRQH